MHDTVLNLLCGAGTTDTDINDIFGKGGSHGSQSAKSPAADAQTYGGSSSRQSGAQTGGQNGKAGSGQSQAAGGKQGGRQSSGTTTGQAAVKNTSKPASEGSTGTGPGQGDTHAFTHPPFLSPTHSHKVPDFKCTIVHTLKYSKVKHQIIIGHTAKIPQVRWYAIDGTLMYGLRHFCV